MLRRSLQSSVRRSLHTARSGSLRGDASSSCAAAAAIGDAVIREQHSQNRGLQQEALTELTQQKHHHHRIQHQHKQHQHHQRHYQHHQQQLSNHRGRRYFATHAQPNSYHDSTLVGGPESDKNNDATTTSVEEINKLAEDLLSYETMQEALVDRGEFKKNGKRFSQFLLADVLKVSNMVHPRELLSLVHTLILPQTGMTVPSHCLNGALNLLSLVFKRYAETTLDYTLEDCLAARELLTKANSLHIYFTTEYSDQEAHRQAGTLRFCLNSVLQMFSNVAQAMHKPAAKRDVIQQAEHLLMEFGGAPDIVPARIHLTPDAVSFNTVMMAWAKSTRKRDNHQSGNSKGSRRNAPRNEDGASAAAAERAQAILDIMLSSKPEFDLTPTTYSYNAVLEAWANTRRPDRAFQVLEKMLKNHEMDPERQPAPLPSSLVVACRSLGGTPAAKIHDYMAKLMIIQQRSDIKMETKLANAILTAYSRSKTFPGKDYFGACEAMTHFWSSAITNPDKISYQTAVEAWSKCVRKLEKRDAAEIEHSSKMCRQYLQEAVDKMMANELMYNHVLASCRHNVEEAELLFEKMKAGGIADYKSCQFMLEAYEHCSKPNEFTCAEKAEQFLFQMEKEAADDPLQLPHTQLHNSIILSWLATECLPGVERAHAFLDYLCHKYQQRMDEYRGAKNGFTFIKERPNTTSFVTVMSGYAKHGNIRHVGVVDSLLQKIEDMQLARSLASETLRHKMAAVETNTIPYNILLDMYAEYAAEDPKLVTKAEELLKRMERVMMGRQKPDSYSYTAILKAYAKSKIPDAVSRTTRLLELAKKVEGRDRVRILTRELYNAVLQTISVNGGEESADLTKVIIDEMNSSGQAMVMPDKVSHSIAIKSMVKAGTLDSVQRAEEALLRCLEEDKSLVDTVSFNTVLSAYTKLHSDEGAECAVKLFQKMNELYSEGLSEVQPDALSYNSVLLTCEAPGAHRLLHDMVDQFEAEKRERDRPEGKAFTSVLNKWFHSDDLDAAEKAEEVLRMKDNFFGDHGSAEPSPYDLNTVLRKFIKGGQLWRAEALFHEMQKRSDSRVDNDSFDTLLGGFAKEGSIEAAVKASDLLESMERTGRAGPVSYRTCITAWSKSNAPDRDEKVEQILNRYIRVEKNTKTLSGVYNILIKCCQQCAAKGPEKDKSIQRALRIFKDMMKLPQVVNHTTFAYMILLCESINDSKRQEALLGSLIQQCKKEGHLSPSVLGVLRKAGHNSLCSRLLDVKEKRFRLVEITDLPSDWSKNVRAAARNG